MRIMAAVAVVVVVYVLSCSSYDFFTDMFLNGSMFARFNPLYSYWGDNLLDGIFDNCLKSSQEGVWWGVDFGRVYKITSVEIFSRK